MAYRVRISLLVLVVSLLILPATIKARLIHRYDFKDGTRDLIGNADGKLVGSAKVADGQLVLDNDNLSSDSAQLSYLEFSSPILPEHGNVTLIAWFTAKKDAGDFSRIVNISDHEDGEGRAFIYVTPHNSDEQSRAAISATDTNGRIFVDNQRLDNDKEHMIAVVIDGDAHKLHFYIDGKESSAAEDLGENTLDKVRQVDRWLGRSSFDRDAGFCGKINEFRVDDEAMTAERIKVTYDVGPDAQPAATAPAK